MVLLQRLGYNSLYVCYLVALAIVCRVYGASMTVLGLAEEKSSGDTHGTIYANNIFSNDGMPDPYRDGTLKGSLILHNGRIHTMDAGNRVVGVLGIRDGWIVYAGHDVEEAERRTAPGLSPTRKIDLRRRVAIPGLIDCHNHIVLLGNRPGYHTPLERAFTVADVLYTYRRRASAVPPGAFITTIGGFAPIQFRESQLPTLSELDSAVPNHPVFISTGFSGPATTNSRGKAFFERLPGDASVSVAANGSIAAGLENGKALLALRQQLTFADRVRSAQDAMAYAASVGVTTHLDQGAFPASNTAADGSGNEDLLAMHLPFLSVYDSASRQQYDNDHDQRSVPPLIRLRINHLHADADGSLPTLTNRLRYSYPFFGNAMVRTGGIGEFAVSIDQYAGGELFESAAARIARAGWRLEVHSLTDADYRGQIEGFERVDAAAGGIKSLRWVVAHVPRITVEYLRRLKALGGGVNLSGFMYLAAAGPGANGTAPAGPPFRTIVASGIPAGFGPDGANIAPLSPWPHAYYATTGRNAKGEVINRGQTIGRQKVLEMFTRDNTWFLGGPDEDVLGVLEVGRLGDVAVLSDDYFAVSDDEVKKLRSVLTVVGGVVVHDSGDLRY
ncbi:amidohydrolase family-domain-containing protein [Chaetomium strumarium]|uniref:Amidohydrolase family-domain-containing protein n=1 Tax=Chaetomium strumarium TaxID=1170767 RepID=A0AAJ0H3N5_9PEZI|nr:amidohydrolase family-domain-containing protein [Chaetomium strumarium]